MLKKITAIFVRLRREDRPAKAGWMNAKKRLLRRMSLNGHTTGMSADNPPKPNTLSIWRRRIHIGTMGMPAWLFSIIAVFFLAGCVGVPVKEAGVHTYRINGTTYFALIPLCDAKNISWEYDTFTQVVTLEKGIQRINLKVGENLVLVNGDPLRLNYPVDLHQGTIVVPDKFKEQVIDALFKGSPQLAGRAASKIKKIVVDAGHGGIDPGAIGRRTGLKEKDVNLDIARRLSSLLNAKGFQVVMTRTSDKLVPLSRRVDIANNYQADLFVSIHSNANRVSSLKGFEIYYVAPSVDDAKRAYEAAKIGGLDKYFSNAELASNSFDLKATLWDMIYTDARAESIELSRCILRSIDDVKIIGIKGARFQVLKGVHMPAVLIEVGFLSNGNEEQMLKNSYYRQKIAEGIFQGIREYSEFLP